MRRMISRMGGGLGAGPRIVTGAPGLPWTAVYTGGAPTASTGWSGWAFRERILAAAITDASATQIRFTIRSAATNGAIVGECWFGLAGVGADDFTGAQQQVTFNSGSTTASIGASTDLVTDPITFAYTGTADLMVFYFFSGVTDLSFYSGSNTVNRQKNSNDHGTTTGVGYAASAVNNAFKLIEVR